MEASNEDYVRAKEFILKIPVLSEPSCRAYSIQISKVPGPDLRIEAGVCHASMQPRKDKIIAAGFQETEDNKHWFNPLKDFLISDKSPWKSLIHDKNGLEYVYKDGRVKGWILPESIVLTSPFQLIKNFTIFTRSITEHSGCFYFWWKLVESGMSMNDALYFCHKFQLDKSVISKATNADSLINGWHWAFTDQNDFNWPALRTGVLNTTPIDRTNYHFRTTTPSKGYSCYYTRLQAKEIKSRFSSYTSYEFDEILQEMDSWMKQKGVK